MSLQAKKIGDPVQSKDKSLIKSHVQVTFSMPNFFLLKEKDGVIYSPTFLDQVGGDSWRVEFYHDSPDFAKATLQLVQSESEKIGAAFQLCLVDQKGNIKWAGEVQSDTFLPERDLRYEEGFSISGMLNPESGWLVDGALLFYVQILTHGIKSEAISHLKSEPEPEMKMDTEQLIPFLLNGTFADVTLTSGNSQFPASKIILAAQSPVFLAMFNSEMRESESNAVVEIEDFSDEIIKGFLEFLYTGQIENLEENAGELLKISDKYQVMRLKAKCERILMKNLVVENAVDILVLAHLYSPENLKPKIMYFANNNFKDLKGTESFQRVKKEYPQLIFDLYEAKCME